MWLRHAVWCALPHAALLSGLMISSHGDHQVAWRQPPGSGWRSSRHEQSKHALAKSVPWKGRPSATVWLTGMLARLDTSPPSECAMMSTRVAPVLASTSLTNDWSCAALVLMHWL